jgi:hypothetical protein
LRARIGAKSSNSIEDFAAVPNDRDTKVFQVFRCEVRKNGLVYFIFAECRLIPSEA